MWVWTAIIIVTFSLSVMATENNRIKIFIANMEDYTQLIKEQAESVAESRNATETLKRTVEEQRETIENNTNTIESLCTKLDEKVQALNRSKCWCVLM